MATTPVSARGSRFKDMTGGRFGRLTVVEEAGRQKNRQVLWRCECECRNIIVVQGSHLRAGHTKSCGCLSNDALVQRNIASAIHGKTGSSEHVAWLAMMSRCYTISAGNYAKYGGRGITVCDRWKLGEGGQHGFECFLADMGAKPSRSHSLDRFPDTAGNYEPGNCRWATIFEQNRNRRNVLAAAERRQAECREAMRSAAQGDLFDDRRRA